MPDDEKKSKEWEQTEAPDAVVEAHAPAVSIGVNAPAPPGAVAETHSVAVRIRGSLPYLVIIFGSVDIIIALAGALGFGLYAIVSGLLLGVVELVIGYISYRAPFLLQRSVTGN